MGFVHLLITFLGAGVAYSV